MAKPFDNSKLMGISLKAEQMWKDAQAFKDNLVEAEGAKAILANQSARFEEITGTNKKRQVRVTWINTCALDTKDVSEDCKLDSDEATSEQKDYDLNMSQETGFKVNAMTERTNEYSTEEVIARNLSDAKARLDNWLAKAVIEKLSLNKGINLAPKPWAYDAAKKTTLVPEELINRKIVANWIQQGIFNRMGQRPYLINGGSLFVDFLNANFDAGNLDGKGDYSRINALNVYIDQFNFGRAGVEEDTFMIGQDAVGLYGHNQYKNDMPEYIGYGVQKSVYRVKSDNLPGIYYDVQYTINCEKVEGQEIHYHVFKLVFNGMFAVNPAGCEQTVGGTKGTPNGIISYTAKPKEVQPEG